MSIAIKCFSQPKVEVNAFSYDTKRCDDEPVKSVLVNPGGSVVKCLVGEANMLVCLTNKV